MELTLKIHCRFLPAGFLLAGLPLALFIGLALGAPAQTAGARAGIDAGPQGAPPDPNAAPARVELNRTGETIVLEAYAPNILRVTLSLNREPALAGPGYGFVAAPAAAGWSASQTERADVYQSDRIIATVDRPAPSTHGSVLPDTAKYFSGSTP